MIYSEYPNNQPLNQDFSKGGAKKRAAAKFFIFFLFLKQCLVCFHGVIWFSLLHCQCTLKRLTFLTSIFKLLRVKF